MYVSKKCYLHEEMNKLSIQAHESLIGYHTMNFIFYVCRFMHLKSVKIC